MGKMILKTHIPGKGTALNDSADSILKQLLRALRLKIGRNPPDFWGTMKILQKEARAHKLWDGL